MTTVDPRPTTSATGPVAVPAAGEHRPAPAAATPAPVQLGLGWDTPGGLNRHLRDLHDALLADGVPTRAVVLGPATEGRAATDPSTVVVAAAEDDPLHRRLLGWARAVRATRVDAGGRATVLDVNFALAALGPVLLGSARRQPLLVHFQGPWAAESAAAGETGPLVVAAKRAVEAAVYRRADVIVVLTAAWKRLVVETYGVDPARVHIVAPGVDLAGFTPDRDGARARLGIAPGATVVFSARRLVPRMGLHVLLDAWRDVVATPGHEDAVLMIAGEGAAADDLAAQAERLGLGASVRLLGRISHEDLVDHYRAADLSVVPSIGLEGFGLVVLESMACGTPVLATDVGGLPEGLRGLDPSLVLPPGDADALAARIARALDGDVPDAATCRAHAERFSWTTAVAHHLPLDALAGERAAAGGRARRRAPLPADRPRVAFLDHCAQLSGGEIALERLLAGLAELAPSSAWHGAAADGAVEAHVILGEDGPLVGRLAALGTTSEVMPLAEDARSLHRDRVRAGRLPIGSALRTGAHVVRLSRRLRRLRPDVVHANSLKSALYGGLAGRLAGVPVVWHARDRIADDYLPGQTARLVRFAARRLPAAVVANSAATLATLGLEPGPGRTGDLRGPLVAVIPDPYRPSRPPATRPAGGDADRDLVIGLVGRLSPWKGQDVALEAFAAAFPDGGARLVLVGAAMFGEDDVEAGLRSRAAELGVADRVELRGFRADVEAELAAMDVLVHASVLPEPFGQVVVEGMAAGLPVIATDAGGPAEIVTHGVDGLLVPPGDVDALAVALRKLADDPALRAHLAAAAVWRAADYEPQAVAPRFSAVYDSVVRSRRGLRRLRRARSESDWNASAGLVAQGWGSGRSPVRDAVPKRVVFRRRG